MEADLEAIPNHVVHCCRFFADLAAAFRQSDSVFHDFGAGP